MGADHVGSMVCESSTRYICNLQIYDGKCGPLTEMVGFLLEPYEGKGYHFTKTIVTIVSIK